MRIRLVLVSFTAFLVLFAMHTYAATPSSILVNIAPENPAPLQNVTITLSSYSADLDSVKIIWSVNDKVTLSGTGEKVFSLKVGAENSSTTVVAAIMLPDGEIDKRIVLTPQTMTLLWQANDSYVPPFYKGKAFPIEESDIKIVAIPAAKNANGTNNSKDMVYAWQQDYENSPENSGYGKNSFSYISDYLDDASTISVTATSVDQKYSSEAKIGVTMNTPKLLFYKQDELGTRWETALADGHKINGDEVIVAAPYFISPADIRIPLLDWSWSINDITVSASGFFNNILPVKVPKGTSGASDIKLNITSPDKLFRSASGELNVVF